MGKKTTLITALILLVLVNCCYASKPDYWPTQAWRTSTPEEQGMDSEQLVKMIDYIRSNDLNVHSITIVRHGYIVLDAYFWPFTPLTKHDIASCTKSFTSTLFGIAIDKGYIKNVRVPVVKFFEDREIDNLGNDKSKITCENLLTMTSGLECVDKPYEITLMQMKESRDWVQYVLDLPVTDEPGSKWAYNSCGSHLLSAIVTNASGLSLEEFGRRFLFDRIGIGQVSWSSDPQGYNHGWGDLQITPRDMARLGFLFLHGGIWDGEQVISRRWVKASTKNQTEKVGPAEGYGYQWWIYKYGSFEAVGRGGQRIFVVPALDLVVVVTGSVTEEETQKYENALAEFVLPSIKSLLRPAHPNPSAFTLLTKKLAEIAAPPPPGAIPELPEIARRVSRKTWVLDSNLAGWQTARFEFKDGENEAYLTITLEGEPARFSIGLDEVPRITSGETLGPLSGYNNHDVAFKGKWSADTFIVEFNTLSLINRGTIKFHFAGDTAKVEFFEKTFVKVPVLFRGKLKEK